MDINDLSVSLIRFPMRLLHLQYLGKFKICEPLFRKLWNSSLVLRNRFDEAILQAMGLRASDITIDTSPHITLMAYPNIDLPFQCIIRSNYDTCGFEIFSLFALRLFPFSRNSSHCSYTRQQIQIKLCFSLCCWGSCCRSFVGSQPTRNLIPNSDLFFASQRNVEDCLHIELCSLAKLK